MSDPDDGAPDAALVAALDAWRDQPGAGTAARVHAALLEARVFVPVVSRATSTRTTEHGLRAESEAEMALVTLVAASGATGLAAFTSPAAMAAWRPEVRPVAVSGPLACRTALDDGHVAVVLDVAGARFPVDGAALEALAAGRLPGGAVVVVAPPGGPQTEALVAALAEAGPPGEAWLVGLEGRGHAVGVSLADPSPEALAAVARSVGAALPPDGPPVDLLPLSGDLLAAARRVGIRLA